MKTPELTQKFPLEALLDHLKELEAYLQKDKDDLENPVKSSSGEKPMSKYEQALYAVHNKLVKHMADSIQTVTSLRKELEDAATEAEASVSLPSSRK